MNLSKLWWLLHQRCYFRPTIMKSTSRTAAFVGVQLFEVGAPLTVGIEALTVVKVMPAELTPLSFKLAGREFNK